MGIVNGSSKEVELLNESTIIYLVEEMCKLKRILNVTLSETDIAILTSCNRCVELKQDFIHCPKNGQPECISDKRILLKEGV